MMNRMRWMLVATLLVAAVAGCGGESPLAQPGNPSFGRTPATDTDPVVGDTLNPDDGYFGSGHTKPPPTDSASSGGPAGPG